MIRAFPREQAGPTVAERVVVDRAGIFVTTTGYQPHA